MTSSFNYGKILVVDDNPQNLSVLIIYLQKCKYEIIVAQTGEEAIDRLKHVHPDVILMDVMMPGMNGFETCKKIKENKLYKDIPVIFMTALSDSNDKIKGFNAGGVDYIVKPFHLEEVVARVSTQIKLQNMQKQLMMTKNMEIATIIAGGVAHDFNNLLLIITGFIELAQTEKGMPDTVNQYLEQARRAGFQASDLIRQLFCFSKGEKPYKKQIPVKQLIHSILDRNPEYQSICSLTIPDDIHSIKIDEMQIKTAFLQVLKNAKDAINSNDTILIWAENIHIKTKQVSNAVPSQPGLYVKICIKDEGHGISQEDINHIFMPYFSTKQKGVQKGMGLGLAIAHTIINNHEGLLHVQSKENEGTLVSIFLPVDDHMAHASTDKDTFDNTPMPDLKILVLLYDTRVSVFMKTILEMMGHTVEITTQKDEAYQAYKIAFEKQNPFHIVIFDFEDLEKQNLSEMVNDLKMIDPNLNAILMVDSMTENQMSKTNQMGIKTILTKPFQFDDLATSIRQAIRLKQEK